jgi:drug/metabolite transporter (DMT)-like permease
LGFGSFFITLRQVGPEAVFWPLVAGRAVSCVVVLTFALITHRWLPLRQSPLRLVALAGTLDALGNLFFLLAIQSGRLDVASVLASLYPAVTTLLARLTIKEHITGVQMAGVAMAVAAIMLITV